MDPGYFTYWVSILPGFQAFRGSCDRLYAINNDFTIYRCCFTGKWNQIVYLRLDYPFFKWVENCFNPIGITTLLKVSMARQISAYKQKKKKKKPCSIILPGLCFESTFMFIIGMATIQSLHLQRYCKDMSPSHWITFRSEGTKYVFYPNSQLNNTVRYQNSAYCTYCEYDNMRYYM